MSRQEEDDDLELLLSLQDRVLETPPASPGYLTDEGSPTQRRQTDLSDFRDVVKDCLDYEPKPIGKPGKSKPLNKKSNESNVEKYSGLRIRNQSLTSTELNERFSDIRFIRLPTIKNLLAGDTIQGCWATVGVLTEKGNPKTSSVGKSYCIWKIGSLDGSSVSLFLFGDAYLQYCKEQAGTVFALFNCSVRKDNEGAGFSLSVYSANQILKMGTSVDYGVCKGKRKDGMGCTLVINKRQGIYCRYHKSKASDRYSTVRTELKGGNLRTAFRDPLKSQGIHVFNPLADTADLKKPTQPVKLLSVEALKRALSKADKVTTNAHSQGIRLFNEVIGKLDSESSRKLSEKTKLTMGSCKRTLPSKNVDQPARVKNDTDIKRKKTKGQDSTKKAEQGIGKMIELDIFSSDEDI